MNNNLFQAVGRQRGLVGLLVFLLPFLTLVTLWGVSLSSFLFFLSSLLILRGGGAALARHWTAVRWVVLAFLFNFALAALYFLSREGAHLGTLEKPARMFFAVSALLLVLHFKPDRRALWWGVIGGALVGVVPVAYQRLALEIERPGGLINAITYGDLALCMGLLSLAAAVDARGTRKALWPALGALAGLLGSILTGTRGGWVALALAALLFVRYAHILSSRRVRALAALGAVLMAATFAVPETGVQQRVRQGVADVSNYFTGVSKFSNIGIRLELWRGAGMLAAEHPLVGTDLSTAQARIGALVKAGRVDAVVLDAPHFHNDAVQAMVTGGVAGLLAWLALLAAPLLFFARALSPDEHANKQQFALALAGLLVVVCYFSFGLTEVIFWSVKASLFYALMIFLLMGFYLNAKEMDGK